MPASTTHKHPDGRTVTFTEDAHTYTDDRGMTYRSVSSVLKQFSPPFDDVKIAARIAARRGVKAEDVIAEWRAAGRAACRYGTRVHEVAEWALRDPGAGHIYGAPPHAPEDLTEATVFPLAAKTAANVGDYARSGGRRLYIEQLLAAPSLGIAGTCDVLIATDDSIELVDWKTNKDLQKTYGSMLEPIAHLDDSPLTKYYLQINLYWRIIKEAYCTGDKVPTMGGQVVHIKRDCEVIEYPVPDMSDEIDLMLRAMHEMDGK